MANVAVIPALTSKSSICHPNASVCDWTVCPPIPTPGNDSPVNSLIINHAAVRFSKVNPGPAVCRVVAGLGAFFFVFLFDVALDKDKVIPTRGVNTRNPFLAYAT